MLNVVLTCTSNISQKMSYANVEELDYYVEQISNYEFNIYFFAEDNNYYRVKEQGYNEKFESDIYLLLFRFVYYPSLIFVQFEKF